MIRRADTMGVFQIESRAQMSMLPRLRPRVFLRPGDRGGHRAARARSRGTWSIPTSAAATARSRSTYPSDAIRRVLEKTLGVPLFQEQAMRLAVEAAGFTPGEADQLRRAMGAWRRPGLIDQFHKKLIDGMAAKGFSAEYAEAVFAQIRGFGDYGFPESHAASFALLVYVSAWLKRHYPAAFAAALLNSQPMGFYAPAQLVRNAREHGVEVLPVDVNRQPSGTARWRTLLLAKGDSIVDAAPQGGHAGIGSEFARPCVWASACCTGWPGRTRERVVEARGGRPFPSLEEFARRTGLGRADAGAAGQRRGAGFAGHGPPRRRLWAALAEDRRELPLFDTVGGAELGTERLTSRSPTSHLRPWSLPLAPARPMSPAEEVLADYRTTGLSLRGHPMEFLRGVAGDRRHSGGGTGKSAPWEARSRRRDRACAPTPLDRQGHHLRHLGRRDGHGEFDRPAGRLGAMPHGDLGGDGALGFRPVATPRGNHPCLGRAAGRPFRANPGARLTIPGLLLNGLSQIATRHASGPPLPPGEGRGEEKCRRAFLPAGVMAREKTPNSASARDPLTPTLSRRERGTWNQHAATRASD